jgi:hypothetical protein
MLSNIIPGTLLLLFDMRDSDPGDDVDDATGLTYTCAAPRADR